MQWDDKEGVIRVLVTFLHDRGGNQSLEIGYENVEGLLSLGGNNRNGLYYKRRNYHSNN